jgi:TolA-binding protein
MRLRSSIFVFIILHVAFAGISQERPVKSVDFKRIKLHEDIDQLQQNLSTMQLELQQLQLQLQDVSQQNLILQQQTVRLAALEILQDSASGDLSIPLQI